MYTLASREYEHLHFLGASFCGNLYDFSQFFQIVRLIKSNREIDLMRHSALVTSKPFTSPMRNTIITNVLEERDLIILDGGCEVNGYASDVTRVWPVVSRFSSVQRELYEVVLRVQEECIHKIRPGVSLDDLQKVMLTSLGKELQRLNFIDSYLSENELSKQAARFFPQNVGHFIGMDVHDTAKLARGLPLQPGMEVTIEPGLYIPDTEVQLPEKYHGSGIRVEDVIVVSRDGGYVLTEMIPKTAKDIDAVLQNKSV